jgi:hypothetical protein
MMKSYVFTLISASIFVTGCASNVVTSPEPASTLPALAQAKTDLSQAKAHHSEWRIIDKATGGSAQDLSKLLKVAEKKETEGDIQEAERIAGQISTFAKMGVAQSLKYKGSKPNYK